MQTRRKYFSPTNESRPTGLTTHRLAAAQVKCVATSYSPKAKDHSLPCWLCTKTVVLNPYVQDVARRFGVAGFLALAPDGLSPIGGYPGNDDEGRTMQRSLDQAKLRRDMVNSARYVKSHPAIERQAWRYRVLLGWWHDQFPRGGDGRRT